MVSYGFMMFSYSYYYSIGETHKTEISTEHHRRMHLTKVPRSRTSFSSCPSWRHMFDFPSIIYDDIIYDNDYYNILCMLYIYIYKCVYVYIYIYMRVYIYMTARCPVDIWFTVPIKIGIISMAMLVHGICVDAPKHLHIAALHAWIAVKGVSTVFLLTWHSLSIALGKSADYPWNILTFLMMN